MNLSIGKFLLLVGALLLAYFVYNYWWTGQNRNAWIRDFNQWVFSSEKEKPQKNTPDNSGGWG